MRRIPILTLIGSILAVGVAPAVAQDAANPYVRESFWKLNFADLEAWNAAYEDHVVPILTDLQSEGVITGWTASMHNTGGDYSWRFALIVPDWASIDTGLAALNTRMASSGMPDMGGMVEAHEDQIWELTELQQREGAPPNPYLYVASFEISASGMDAWQTFYSDVWVPALRGAMDAELIDGWAVEEHASGGPMNWQILYLLPSWDAADDVWAMMFEAFEAHPQAYEAAERAIRAHEDNIWQTLTVDTGNE